MSIVIELADGSNTGAGLASVQTLTSTASKTITFTTPNTITLAGTSFTWSATAATNDVIRIVGSTSNDGSFTIKSRVSSTVITVYEDSITTSASVVDTVTTLFRRDPGTSVYSGALNIESYYLNPLRINFVAGTNLKKFPVQVNDRLMVKSSGGGAGAAAQIGNDGSWRVARVRNATLVQVDTGAKGTNTLVKRNDLTKGTGEFKVGAWNAKLTNQGVSTFGDIKYGATAPGSATGHTFILDHFYTAGTTMGVYPFIGLQGIQLVGANSIFRSRQEVILNKQILPYTMLGNSSYVGDRKCLRVWSKTTGATVVVGTEGVDAASTSQGSILVGFDINAAGVFGSLINGQPGSAAGFTTSDKIYNSLILAATLTSQGPSDFQNVLVSPGVFPIVAQNSGGSYKNIILTGSATTAATINTLTEDLTMSNITIAQSLFDGLPSGLFNVVGSFTLILLDLASDYDITTLGTGKISKQYTYNPTFVSRNDSGTSPIPIAGLSVKIWQIDESAVETLVFDGVTDLNGQLNAGVGTALQRQFSTPETFTHRIRVEGLNYTAVNQIFSIMQKSVFVFPIAAQATDFEGEFNY